MRGRRGTSGCVLGICVAGVALGALCLEFAWQARHLGLSKGGDVRSGVVRCRAWAPGLCAWNLRGRRGTSGSPRGVMYALASFGVVLGLRGSVLGLCVAGAALQALQGA